MGIAFYNLFIQLYVSALQLASWWNPKARLWLKGRKNILERIEADLNMRDSRYSERIWMHCASLGEFEQGRPLLEKIRADFPGAEIILTFYSPSGFEIRKDYAGADHIYYLPLDTPANARKFIDIVQPKLVLWVKYEYWYHYLTELKKRRIPVLLISGVFRQDQLFFRVYGSLWREMLDCFKHFFVQNEDSKKLLGTVGLSNNVTISGDTRFDRVIEIAEKFEPIPPVEDFCRGHKVIVAGSTWTEDEEEMTHYVRTHPEIRFIIAPHEVDSDNIRDLRKEFKTSILYSDWVQTGNGNLDTANVLIIDNIGMLARLYKYGSITYVGGGFGEDGIHNILEPAVYGKPVVFGPVYEKYFEADEMLDAGGAISIENALELEAEFNRLWNDESLLKQYGEAAKTYVYQKAGATGHIIEYIQRNLLLTI